MRRSAARSSIVIALVGFLCFASSSPANAGTATSYLRIYGAYLPDRVEWNDTHWGYGLAARTTLNPRWGIDIGAARFTSSDRALTPMTVGFSYGPESRKGPRPWIEFGAGLYRLESTASTIVRVIPTNDFNTERTSRPKLQRNNVGGYLGLGFDVPLSSRIGLGSGVRIHAWSFPDGLIALQTGLSYGF